MPKPLRTGETEISPRGGMIRCHGCQELDLIGEQRFRSTSENGRVTVRMEMYAPDSFPGPSGKVVGSEMLAMTPTSLKVDDYVQVNLSWSNIASPQLYGKSKRGWVALKEQISVGSNVQGGKWKNSGAQKYTQFCVAGDPLRPR